MKSASNMDYHRKRKLRARLKFKAIVRQVMANYDWLLDTEGEELGENVLKNIYLLTIKRKNVEGDKKSLLTLYDKTILCKQLMHRTQEENDYIAKKLAGLKCFRRYPTEVKNKLAAATHYVYYRPGRVIVRQFHEAHALYFIVSGTVVVKQQYEDPISEIVEDKIIGTMEVGDLFGEVSLLHNIPRTATIETSTACDLLMLKASDFNRVLKVTVEAEWKAILRALNRFSYFANFSEIERRECCILSKIREFKEESVMIGGSSGNINYVHFILSGTATIFVQLLTDQTFSSFKGNITTKSKTPFMPSIPSRNMQTKYSAPVNSFLRKYAKYIDKDMTTSSFDVTLPNDTTTHIIQVAEIKELACFCVGEDLTSKFIVAKNNVTCLQIPYFWLIQRNRLTWVQLELFWKRNIPKPEKLFKILLEQKKWRTYCRSFTRNKVAQNYLHNVPYSIRLKDLEACQFNYEYY